MPLSMRERSGLSSTCPPYTVSSLLQRWMLERQIGSGSQGQVLLPLGALLRPQPPPATSACTYPSQVDGFGCAPSSTSACSYPSALDGYAERKRRGLGTHVREGASVAQDTAVLPSASFLPTPAP